MDTFNQNILCNPYGRLHRFIVLIFMCFLLFGSYFCYDNPSALESQLEKTVGINNQQYGYLYSIYSWPSVIIAFFGGYLIDWVMGVRWGSIIFVSLIAVGQFVFAMGGYFDLFWLMIVGRFIYALGGEPCDIAQSVYAVKWFKGKELNAVFGIQLSFANAASTVNQFAMLPIYNAIASSLGSDNPKVLGSTLLVSTATCLISVGCGFALWWFDKRRDKHIEKQYEHDCLTAKSIADLPRAPDKVKITPKEILHFPLSFWLLCMICITFYISFDGFYSFSQLFFVNKFQMTAYQGSICNGLSNFMAIPCLIFGGFLIDYFGRNAQFIIISVIMALFGHCMLAFTFWSPFIASAILGCAYSLFCSALWPAVAYIVHEHTIATSYGVMQAILNLGLALSYLFIGVIADNKGYFVVELFYIASLCLSLGVAISLYFVDYGRGEGYLLMNGAKRRKMLSN